MRILIVNKFFYPRGGDCVVAMNTQRLLESKGHDVRIYAMTYPDNVDTSFNDSYASEVNFSAGIMGKISAFKRIFGKGDIVDSFKKVLHEFKPDVVHLHNIHSYLSPVVGELAHQYGARVVWTLHDYKLVCPSYSCRLPDGKNCEQCINGDIAVIKHKCMKGSALQSFIADVEARYWSRQRLVGFTDKFIAPSAFMSRKMQQGGLPESKLTVVCNFIDPSKYDKIKSTPVKSDRQHSFCYIGRLSEEKGVRTLIKAAVKANVVLNIAGGGPLLEELKEKYRKNKNIHFLGHLSAEKTAELLMNSQASIMPSECYENNPLGVIESLCAGTPVIGANIGGIPELIDNESGIVYPSGDVEELADKLTSFDRSKYNNRDISERSLVRFSAETHYRQLLEAYEA